MNGLKGFNVHSIILQVPIASITASGSKPSKVTDAGASIGFYTTASRQASRVISGWFSPGERGAVGPGLTPG